LAYGYIDNQAPGTYTDYLVANYTTSSVAGLLGTSFSGTITYFSVKQVSVTGGNLVVAGALMGPLAAFDTIYALAGDLGGSVDGTTQTTGDNTTKLATDAFVLAQIAEGGATYSNANTLTGLPSGCVQLPCTVTTDTHTAMQANLSLTQLVASAVAGQYELDVYEVFTQAGTSAGVLPVTAYLSCTDPLDSLQKSSYVNSAQGYNNNSTNTASSLVAFCDAKAGTAIKYGLAGYSSTGATPMQYKSVAILKRIN
jgi:hypothetical protein